MPKQKMIVELHFDSDNQLQNQIIDDLVTKILLDKNLQTRVIKIEELKEEDTKVETKRKVRF